MIPRPWLNLHRACWLTHDIARQKLLLCPWATLHCKCVERRSQGVLVLIRLTDALPDSFEGVLQAAHKAAEHQPDSGMEDWQMQQDIIQQDFAPLLARFVEAEDHQVRIQLGGRPA